MFCVLPKMRQLSRRIFSGDNSTTVICIVCVFLMNAGTHCSAQVLQYPDASLSGDLVKIDSTASQKSQGRSPEPREIPRKSTKSTNSPKPLVKNTGPLVIVENAPQNLIQPVAGSQPPGNSSSRPRPVFDDPLPSLVQHKEIEAAQKTAVSNGNRGQSRKIPDRSSQIASQDRVSSPTPPRLARNSEIYDPYELETEEDLQTVSEEGFLRPVEDDPNEHDHDHDKVPQFQSAMFLGVKPGTSTLDEVLNQLGAPQKTSRSGRRTVHLYSMEEVEHIEITFENDIVFSIEVIFAEAYPVDQVREILAAELQKTRPVSFADERGDVIGLMFPEKGLTLVYTPSEQPGVPSAMVKKIAILPISAEPFVIRAKGYLEESPQDSRSDLRIAASLDDSSAEMFWLTAQVDLISGDGASAMEQAEKALSREPSLPQYHLTLAKSLVLMNRTEEARMYLEEMLPLCNNYQHQKAVALSLLGDLCRDEKPGDYELAYQYHKEAIDIAIQLREHSNPSVRGIAREVLIDAQLGVIRDIAQGNWDNKWAAIEKWFASVQEIIKDPEVVAKKRLVRDYLLRVAHCGLSARVAVSDSTTSIDPYVRDVLTATEEMLNVSDDPIVRGKIQWETSRVLFEAFLFYQNRKQYNQALKIGETTVDLMEQGILGRTGEDDFYVLSEVYFRLGANYAIGMKNHRAAIVWFDRTLPVFEDILPGLRPESTGRIGEMLVSMGVSYWETNQKSEAIEFSEEGLKMIKSVVDRGLFDPSALIVPYSNLSTMWSKMDEPEKAEEYYHLAAKIREARTEAGSTRNETGSRRK